MPVVIDNALLTVVDEEQATTAPLTVVDGLVAANIPAAASDADVSDVNVVDATGCVVTPGLINSHHHLLQSAFRALPGSRFRPMSQWLKVMGAAYSQRAVDPELAYAAAAVGLAESTLCGVTTVADHHLTWPAGIDPVELAGASIASSTEIGTRLVFVRGTARCDPHAAAESIHAIHAAYFADATHGVNPDGMLQLAVGPSGVHADPAETFRELALVAAELGLRRRTQANEQVDVEIAESRYGRRPLELLDEWGWLAPDVTIAHLCEVTEGEIELLSRSGVSATHAPGCDVPMGWGVAPVAQLREAGIAVGLGTSGGGSNDGGHLLADARLALQVSGLIGAPVSAHALIGCATAGSAAGLDRPELGHLRPGAAADLCIWDCADVADAGVADLVDGLLWASPGRRPRDVMIGGRWVVRDYHLTHHDSRDIAARLTALLRQRDGA